MQAETLSNKINTPSVADIAPKIQLIKNKFASGKTKPLPWRIEQLTQIRKMVVEQQDKILWQCNRILVVVIWNHGLLS